MSSSTYSTHTQSTHGFTLYQTKAKKTAVKVVLRIMTLVIPVKGMDISAPDEGELEGNNGFEDCVGGDTGELELNEMTGGRDVTVGAGAGAIEEVDIGITIVVGAGTLVGIGVSVGTGRILVGNGAAPVQTFPMGQHPGRSSTLDMTQVVLSERKTQIGQNSALLRRRL